ncbi:MAG TPA: type II secretion system protein GspJ [Dongiaceae bacterium]|nr:type II secretion system protein GspJ [Dongiaceae bacterium]
MNRKFAHQDAFTLIEMILAIGVAAIVLVAVNAVFFAGMHLQAATQEAVDAAAPLARTESVLERDLQCAVTPKTNALISGDFRVGTITSPGVDQPVAIELCTATGALSESQPWGDVQRVTYGLQTATERNSRGRDLIRTITRNLLSDTTPEVTEQWLLGGVESLQVSCYDGSQWQDTWDTSDTTGVTTNLPLAIRIRIQMAADTAGAVRLQPLEFLVPIDSQSRSNVTSLN